MHLITRSFSNWANTHLRLLWFYDGQPKQLQRSANASPNTAYSAWYVQRGSVRVGDGPISVASVDNWVLLPPRQVSFDFSPDALITSIHFQAEWHNGRPLFPDMQPIIVSPGHPLIRGHGGLSASTQALRGSIKKHYGELSVHPSDTQSSLCQYLAVMASATLWIRSWIVLMTVQNFNMLQFDEHDDPRVAEATRLIDTQALDGKFPERLVATRIGLTSGHLDRLFVSSMGMTVKAYAENRRLDLARRELSVSESSIKQLSYKLGFRQPSYFTTWFRKHTGT